MKLRLTFLILAIATLATPLFAQTTMTSVEQMSGWTGCSACAQAGTTSVFSMTQKVSSPSLDGASAKFYIGGNKPWGLALWHKFLGYHDTYHNFSMDFYQYGNAMQNSNGIEYALSQAVGNKWYKFSVQFSFNKHVISVWDSAAGHWVSTGVALPTPSNNTWHHYTFNFAKTSDGHAKFLTFVLDGHTYYINKAFGPQSTSNHGVSAHMQLNMNGSGQSFTIWIDKFTIKMS